MKSLRPDIWHPDEVWLSESEARGGFRYFTHTVCVAQMGICAWDGEDANPKLVSFCFSYNCRSCHSFLWNQEVRMSGHTPSLEWKGKHVVESQETCFWSQCHH